MFCLRDGSDGWGFLILTALDSLRVAHVTPSLAAVLFLSHHKGVCLIFGILTQQKKTKMSISLAFVLCDCLVSPLLSYLKGQIKSHSSQIPLFEEENRICFHEKCR